MPSFYKCIRTVGSLMTFIDNTAIYEYLRAFSYLKIQSSVQIRKITTETLHISTSFVMESPSARCEITSFLNRTERVISTICFLAFCFLCCGLYTNYDVPADLAFMILILPTPFWFIAMANGQHDCEKSKGMLDIEAQRMTKTAEDELPTYEKVI